MRPFSLIACLFVCVLITPPALGDDRANPIVGLSIFPESIDLTHGNSLQIVTAQPIHSNRAIGRSVATAARWTIADPSVASISIDPRFGVTIVAKGAGETTLSAAWSDESGTLFEQSAKVVTHAMDRELEPEFTNHILSLMARNGCNMGACHGALAGKGGFRLSLRGYDPISDHFNITRQDRGRRIERSQPESSLVLTKPSGIVDHKGGVRLPESSSDYQLVLRWISRGANGPQPTDPKLERLEILPAAIRLAPGNAQQLIVRAHYSNGRIEDVTRWAKYSSADESVATVDEHGLAKVIGPGEGAVNGWFASRIVTSRIQVPFVAKEADLRDPKELEIANLIDTHVAAQLRALALEPSPRCSDSEFLRRTSLDATGSLPSEAQVREFLADTSADKRSRWVDGLLESPEYVDYWTYRWSDLLMLNSNLLRADGIRAYYGWIRSKVAANTPWDEFTREILTARGEALENGATNFYAINQDPEGMTENACQAFMGLSIGCAKCHNHPLEKWTNDQYYAMANMFARVRAKGWGGDVRDGDAARTVMVLDRGDLIQPLRGKPQPPAPLDGSPLDMDSTEDRRKYLADWMTSPENPYFTRAITNRVWAAYFGIGIVNAVDDLRASNPASNPALMQGLSQYLVEHRYDLKSLMRLIMNSEAYQRSSETTPRNREDRKYFSHYYPKRLMAEVLHDAIANVSAIPTPFDKVSFLGGDKRDTKFYAKGTKAIQLFDSSVENNFLKTFGRNQRRITCECERSDEPSIIQVLNLNNGDTLNTKLAAGGNIVEQLQQEFGDRHESLVESAFLRCLSRMPTDQERTSLAQELQGADSAERRVVLEDLLWSIMTSREFLFNH